MYSKPFPYLPAVLCALSTAALGLPEGKPALTPETIEAIKTEVELACLSIIPKNSGNPPTSAILPNECFAMWGDLFSNGHLWAVIETKKENGVAYLEWKNGRWQFRELLDITACWLPKGVKPEDRGYYHINPTPPSQAFKLKNINADGSPVLLIPFNNDGYNLGYAIATPLPKNAGIKIVEFSMAGEPDAAFGYLITYNASGRKAWWGQRIYHKWVNGVPVKQATWTDGNVNKTDEGPTWLTIETTRLSPVGERHYRILKEDNVVLRDDQPFAAIKFTLDKDNARAETPIDGAATEELYFFERLTGLPWKAYGSNINGTSLEFAKKWQQALTVEFTGTPEGIKLFSANFKTVP